MKCKIFECNKEAQGNYPCCSQEHGTSLRMRKENIKDALNGDTQVDRSMYSVEEAIYYLTQ